MSVEVIGIDHVFITVSDLQKAEEFYDKVMPFMGFVKAKEPIGGDPHVHFFNRHYGFTIRPARNPEKEFDSYAPGLHHFCFRVDTTEDIDKIAFEFERVKIAFDPPKFYPEYAPDYYAIFFNDPDGIRLEVTNFRQNRKDRFLNWEQVKNDRFD